MPANMFEIISFVIAAFGLIEFMEGEFQQAIDNPDLPVSFIMESLASLAEPRESGTPFIPRSRKL